MTFQKNTTTFGLFNIQENPLARYLLYKKRTSADNNGHWAEINPYICNLEQKTEYLEHEQPVYT